MQRIVNGGEGGIANVSVAATDGLPPFFHTGYDEVYYIFSGAGTVTLDGRALPLATRQRCRDPGRRVARLGSIRGTVGVRLFGTPPMAFDDERAKPRRA